MKRKALLKHLEKRGCLLLREGANHSVFINGNNNKISTVPRHSEINEILARKICKDLEIELP
ncbi:MAG: type II toxin-antitoxin system HicA family toxin [Candidatus Aminicenantes bacterium]|nr:type II toxin-antitoxin system HicA family toxin [Candidatus Aminicenantes bacterium]